MAVMKVKLDGKQYTVTTDPDELTLGELEILQDHFGLGEMREYNFLVPSQMTGVIAIAVRRVEKDLDLGEVFEKARKLKYGTFIDAYNKQADEEKAEAEKKPDPTQPAAKGRSKSAGGPQSSPTT